MSQPLETVPGAEIVYCPEPGCDSALAGGDCTITHHGDGSHTFTPHQAGRFYGVPSGPDLRVEIR